MELVVGEAVEEAAEEVEEVVERLDAECGRGEGGVSGESELDDQAGEEDVDSVSAVDSSDSPIPGCEWRFGFAYREGPWLVRGAGDGEAEAECGGMVLIGYDKGKEMEIVE